MSPLDLSFWHWRSRKFHTSITTEHGILLVGGFDSRNTTELISVQYFCLPNISSLIPILNTFCRWMNGTATKAFSWTQKDFFIVQSRCYQHPKTKLLHHWRHLDKRLIFHLDRRLGDTKSCHWIHHGWPSGSPPSVSSKPLRWHRKEAYMAQQSAFNLHL